jgi:hypothetical protein
MQAQPEDAEPELEDLGPLTPRLERKLAELRAAGFTILWIVASRDDLETLLREGGDQAVRMDPDRGAGTAWFGDVEVRYSPHPGTWVDLEGEYEEMSRHGV